MMPRSFFFGMVEVPFWEWRSGLTIAQIELLTIDQPIVVYKKDDKEKPWKNGTVSEDYAASQLRKWQEGKKQREREGKTIDIEKAFANGKKVDFNEFLRTGEKKEID